MADHLIIRAPRTTTDLLLQELGDLTAERDRLRAVVEQVKDALHSPTLATEGSRLIGISLVLNALTPPTEAEIAHAQQVWEEIRPTRSSESA